MSLDSFVLKGPTNTSWQVAGSGKKRKVEISPISDEIKAALEELGFNCQNITNIQHWRSKELLPLFFVDLEPEKKLKEIYNLLLLLHMQIKVKSTRPQKTVPPLPAVWPHQSILHTT